MSEKTLLILGASSEVGIRYIEKYGREYNKIFAHYNSNAEELKRLISEGFDNVELTQCNLLEEESIEEMILRIIECGMIPTHIMFLPARKTQLRKIEETDLIDVKTDLNLQVIACSMIIQRFIPYIKDAKYGRICVMLSSVTHQPVAYNYSYIVSKYALLGVVKALAKELAPFGITVNAVSPTMINTKFVAEASPFVKKRNIDMAPLNRLAETDDVIPALHFFMSEESRYITGDNLMLSGGAVIS